MSTSQTGSADLFKEQIRAEWTDAANIAAWKKWHPKFAIATRESTDVIVQVARIEPGMRVLDLCSGTGEPALALARALGSDGLVTATDLGADMLKVAEENARQAGLTNLTFRQADAHKLPFADQTFDRVTCRFGVYYFADAGQALREIRRVLKPGGLVALIALGPLEQNPFSLCFLEPFLKRANVPPPPPGAPHPFKFADQGSLTRELENAEFRQVEESFRSVTWTWPGPPEEFCLHLREVSAPFHPIIDSLPPDQQQQAINEVVEGFSRYYDGHRVNAPAVIVVASAAR